MSFVARSERVFFFIAALAVAPVALAACQVLVPLVSDVAPAEAGTDTNVVPEDHGDAAGDAPDPCFGEGPAAISGTSRNGARLVLAVNRWRFDEADDTAPSEALCGSPGVDIDRTDTRGDCRKTGTCAPRGQTAVCDLAHGVDDSLSRMIAKVRALSAKSLPDPNTLLETGTGGLILQIDGYNGEADDEDVQLTLFAAAGIDGHVPDAGTGQVFAIANLESLPKVWDAGSKDVGWLVDERSYTSDGTGFARPADTTQSAYVRDHVLVADLHDGTFPLGVPGVPDARYTSGRLIARLAQGADGRWRLVRGRVGVRCPSSALLTAIAAGHTPTSGGSGQLCLPSNEVTYALFRSAACEALDLPPAGATDPSASCADISAGFTFSAIDTEVKLNPTEPGKYAAIRSVFGSSLPCPDDAGTYVCDSCDWDGPHRCRDGGVVDGN